MASEFHITEPEVRGDVALIRASGRLDAKTAQELLKTSQQIRTDGNSNLVINLSEISFVASSGIGTLLAITEEFKEADGHLHLVQLSEPVESVVNLLNLSQFLSIDSTEADAIQAMGA